MPSLRTRMHYTTLALSGAQDALADAAVAVASATDALVDIEAGTLDLDAVTVGGQRFVNNGGVLELEP